MVELLPESIYCFLLSATVSHFSALQGECTTDLKKRWSQMHVRIRGLGRNTPKSQSNCAHLCLCEQMCALPSPVSHGRHTPICMHAFLTPSMRRNQLTAHALCLGSSLMAWDCCAHVGQHVKLPLLLLSLRFCLL